MPDPDPKVTVPSDEELRYVTAKVIRISQECGAGYLPAVYEIVCQVRDRTREATLSEIAAELQSAKPEGDAIFITYVGEAFQQAAETLRERIIEEHQANRGDAN